MHAALSRMLRSLPSTHDDHGHQVVQLVVLMLVKSPPTDYRDCKYEEEAGMPEAPLNRDSSALLNFAIDGYGERDVNESVVLLQPPVESRYHAAARTI